MKNTRLDNFLLAVAPKFAINRIKARAFSRVINENVRKYDAASKGRRTDGWGVADGSANTETRHGLRWLRARSRETVRNDPYGARAIQRVASNTVGTGIQPTPAGPKAKVKAAAKAWSDWAETTACDWDGDSTFYGLQNLIMRTVAESGECLILKRRVPKGSKMPLQIQVVEPDFLDSDKDLTTTSDGGWITQGVEFDADGKKKGYWLFKRHPAEFGQISSSFVPAEDVIHVYLKERPGQVRGVPFGVSALLRLKDFNGYEDAELVRQKIAACFAAFVHDADPANPGTSTSDSDLDRLEPGIIQELSPGKTISFASPPSTSNYEAYGRSVLRGAAAGYGVTYEGITGDLSNVNFSSGRMGWLEFQRLLTDYQELMLIPRLCDRVWGWFLDALEMSSNFRRADLSVSWTSPAREMIDPYKETQAKILQVRAGFVSWSEVVRQGGYDPEKVKEEIAKDFAWMKENGFVLDVDPTREKKLEAESKAKPEEKE